MASKKKQACPKNDEPFVEMTTAQRDLFINSILEDLRNGKLVFTLPELMFIDRTISNKIKIID